jgi:predicted CXXCH cytochrome family protein
LSLHAPYANLECLDCHDPHGGARKDLLVATSTGELCATCHVGYAEAASHEPVTSGQCDSCHSPHTSSQPFLLKRPKEELCCSCHGEFRELLPESVSDRGTLAHVHEALLEQGCGACHTGHGGSQPALLALSVQDTCRNCHEEIFDGIGSAHSVHAAFEGEDSCIECHSPHASTFDSLLLARGSELCLGCHDEPLAKQDGGDVANILEVLTSSTNLHGPVAAGDCAVCHVAHYSSERALLRRGYPSEIYADISSTSYALCFECHDRGLVENELSHDTWFRDGDRNLHFVHVNREKGRACDICHASHGSQRKALLREEFPFGPARWPMPIDFEATESGGSCASACHERKTYDRTQPSHSDTTLESASR